MRSERHHTSAGQSETSGRRMKSAVGVGWEGPWVARSVRPLAWQGGRGLDLSISVSSKTCFLVCVEM